MRSSPSSTILASCEGESAGLSGILSGLEVFIHIGVEAPVGWGRSYGGRSCLLQQAIREDDLDDFGDRLDACPIALQLAGEGDPADRLSTGLHYIEVAAFLKRDPAQPPIFASFRKVIRVDR